MHDRRAQERMSRPDDARALRSRAALRDALIALITEQPFHAISIRAITQRAGVSYPVFFRRYGTKEELLADIAAAEVRALMAQTYPALRPEGPEASLRALCGYVADHRALWSALLTTEAAGAMRSEFATLSAAIGNGGEKANPWLPVTLASRVVATGLFEVLAWWLEQDEDYPIENIVAFLMELIVDPALRPRPVTLVPISTSI